MIILSQFLGSQLLILLSLFAPEHLILIAFVVLLLFGGKKIPELMKGMGKGVREFTDAKNNITSQMHESMKEDEPVSKDEEIENLRRQVQLLQQKEVLEAKQIA